MKIEVEKKKVGKGYLAHVETDQALNEFELLGLTLPVLTLKVFGRISTRFIQATLKQVRHKRVFSLKGKKAVFVEKKDDIWLIDWNDKMVEITEPPVGWHTTEAAIYSLVDVMARDQEDARRLYEALIMAEILKDNPDKDRFDDYKIIKHGDKEFKIWWPPDLEDGATLEQAIDVLKKARQRVVKCSYCGAVIPNRQRVYTHNFCSDKCRVRWHRQHKDGEVSPTP